MERVMSSFGDSSVNMPYSLDAEQAVIGSVLIDPGCLPTVSDMIRPDYFYIPQHRAIFTTVLNIDALGGKIDPLLVLEELKKDGVYDEASGKNYLAQLAQAVPSTANVDSYAKIIKEKYLLRTLMETAQDIIRDSSAEEESADLILDAAEQKIYNIRQGKNNSGPSKIGDIIVNEVYDRLQKLSSADREQFKGISTGFSDLDRMITGLNRSDLILVGARPAMGKTSFALNIARNVAVMAKRKVVFFSLEMSKEQLAQRILSTEARLESSKMRTGEITADEWVRLASAAAALGNAELYFDDTSNITVPEMKARVRRMKDVDVVIIDYLQLMQGSKRTESRVQEVSEVTRSLKLMAKDLNIPVITCSQLARRTEERGKSHKPQLSDLRESGSIEQDADIVMMLYREAYYDNDSDEPTQIEANKAEVLVQKNRHGSTGSVELAWNGDYTMFSTIEKIRDDR